MEYRLLLYEGRWKPRPSRRAIRAVLDGLSSGCWWAVVDYAFVAPEEDVAFAVELSAVSQSCDAEHVRDGIIEEFLASFEPEFESMIEVETMT